MPVLLLRGFASGFAGTAIMVVYYSLGHEPYDFF